MKTQAVLFDKDGTLLDLDKFWIPVAIYAAKSVAGDNADEEILQKMLESIGVSNETADVTGTLCCGTNGEIGECFYEVLCKNGINIEKNVVMEKVINAVHDGASVGVVAPTCKNLAATLEKLKNNNIKLAVVTSDDACSTANCLEKLGIKKYFDAVYTEGGELPHKPAPDMLYDFCEKFDVDKECVVMVGDTYTDMNFAKNAGVRAVGVAKTEKHKEYLMKKTDTVIQDVSYIFDVID